MVKIGGEAMSKTVGEGRKGVVTYLCSCGSHGRFTPKPGTPANDSTHKEFWSREQALVYLGEMLSLDQIDEPNFHRVSGELLATTANLPAELGPKDRTSCEINEYKRHPSLHLVDVEAAI